MAPPSPTLAHSRPRYALAIHGGCGTLTRALMSSQREAAYLQALTQSLDAGRVILERGGSSLDAVEAAVASMEDSPLFNAGHGSVFNLEGGHELDAAIMDGKSLLAGALAGARHIRNPIRVCRAIMERSDNLLLVGEGADAFAEAHGFQPVPQSYFDTDWRRVALAEVKELAAKGAPITAVPEAQKHGTVGAVALDARGDLAAATSTGGFTNKILGRVGDSPIIGAGTYADNTTCALSATGKGEFFVRKVLAHEIASRMRYQGTALADACEAMVMHELMEWGSGAGLVAVDRQGNVTMPFNTEGMYRGSVLAGGAIEVAIYR
ncbi:MAG: isoaspartyl peptidase/L-asparaginase [Proteobacteria bacterium]|nr:isoaspartyl peptidase/L-asparaginase [Pseudomonadota bacterium]MBI3499057.1 isoaspartyl peptidase/L-asparaginase [Pseudomonadota bacterium]